ncbi:unknown [Blautia hydrogenotrophica CAG:147]|nr:unknown [Blautia hydrogenotrophica CAG:147]
MRNGKLDKVIGCDAYYFIRLFYCVGNFVPYAIKSPPGRMHTPQ